MRLSNDPNDSSISLKEWHDCFFTARVFLNDIEQKFCTVADEEAGYVVRCATDANGKFVTDDAECILSEKVFGKVRIVSGI